LDTKPVVDHNEHQIGPLECVIRAQHMVQELQIHDISTGKRLATCKESAAKDPQETAEDGVRDFQMLEVLIESGTRSLAGDQLPEMVAIKTLRE